MWFAFHLFDSNQSNHNLLWLRTGCKITWNSTTSYIGLDSGVAIEQHKVFLSCELFLSLTFKILCTECMSHEVFITVNCFKPWSSKFLAQKISVTQSLWKIYQCPSKVLEFYIRQIFQIRYDRIEIPINALTNLPCVNA